MSPLVHKHKLAEQDLINIWLYTFEEWGDKQADIYLDELSQTLKLIAEQPNIGRLRKEFIPPVRTFYHSHHLIAYQVIEGGISVIRVLHKSMDVDTHLNELK